MCHADFAHFQQHYTRLIDDMVAFAHEHANQLMPPIIDERLQAITSDLATFKSHLFDTDRNFFSNHKELMYGVGFDTVVQLNELLQDTRIALQRRMDTVINVAPETTVCAGGCITGLQTAVSRLSTSAHGITACAHRFKRQMLDYAALEHTRRRHHYYSGDEVHYANAYFNYGAHRLGVAPRPDPFTGTAESTITQTLFNEFDRSVRETVRPETMIRAMADDYASQISAVAETDDAGNIAAEKIGATVGRIEALQEAQLNAEFGPIPLHDFLMEMPADGSYRLTKRPTLIAVRLMDRLKKERLIQFEPVVLAKAVDGEADALYLDGLLWLNRKGQHELFDVEMLCRVSPSALLDTLSHDDSIDNKRRVQIFCEIAETIMTLCAAEQLATPHNLPHHWLENFVAVLPQLSGSRKSELESRAMAMVLRFDDGTAMHRLLETGIDKNMQVQSGFSLVSMAAARNWTNVLRVLLQWRVDIEAGADEETSALMIAARTNQSRSLTTLLDAGARVDAVTANGKTALIIAAENGHAQIVRSLLDAGADPHVATKIGDTALHKAAKNGDVDVLRALIKGGARVNAAGDANFTVLMVAAQCGHARAVEFLLAANADSTLCADIDQHTVLTLAALNGHTEVVEALLAAGAPVEARLSTGHTALMLAASFGNTEIIQILLNKKAGIEDKTVKEGYSALMLATIHGHAATVAMLAAAGADRECQSSIGNTPLMEAAIWGNHAVLTALLASGAQLETRSSDDGQTALVQAAFYNETESLRLLLAAGALIDAQTESGQTALALAAHHDNSEAVELLAQCGASTEYRTADGFTPLMVMAQRGRIRAVEALLSASASRDSRAPGGRSAGDMVQDAYALIADSAQANAAHENP